MIDIFPLWIVFCEKSAARSVPWVVRVMVLGGLVTSLCAPMALLARQGEWKWFRLGYRAESA